VPEAARAFQDRRCALGNGAGRLGSGENSALRSAGMDGAFCSKIHFPIPVPGSVARTSAGSAGNGPAPWSSSDGLAQTPVTANASRRWSQWLAPWRKTPRPSWPPTGLIFEAAEHDQAGRLRCWGG